MSGGWDNEEARAFVARLGARRDSLELAIERPPPRASLAAAWLWARIDLVGAAEVLAQARGRYTTTVGDLPPGSIKVAMSHNTKPFVLWNVSRDEAKGLPLKFEKGPSYRVGGAALEEGLAKDREGMPGKVAIATRVLREEIEERDFIRMQAFGAKRMLKRTLADDLSRSGLGKPDPVDEPQGE